MERAYDAALRVTEQAEFRPVPNLDDDNIIWSTGPLEESGILIANTAVTQRAG
jgi:hypothetical protein